MQRQSRVFLSVLFVLPALLMGILIAYRGDISMKSFIPNMAALVLGGLFLFSQNIWSTFFRRYARILSFAALIIIAGSLFSVGLESVHRWIQLGPMFLNVSMAFCPLVLYGMVRCSGWISLSLALICALIHFLQPDAGQGTAFVFAAIVILFFDLNLHRVIRILTIISLVVLLVLTWKADDPLLPVRHVEDILFMAEEQGRGYFIMALGQSRCEETISKTSVARL